MRLFDWLKRPEKSSSELDFFLNAISKEEVSTNRKAENKKAEISLKVTETSTLESFLELEPPLHKHILELYCPVRKARIFCHSILIDKLGDLTRFIISSLHDGHSIEEVCRLTQMGNITIEEETNYLVRGGLISESGDELTELGHQYGILLKVFNTISNGIEVVFNEFANLFEKVDGVYISNPDEEYILEKKYILALTRNEDYANSKEVALEHIEAGTPFCREIRSSLYTTVKMEKEPIGYKPVYIKDFSKGTINAEEPCVGIAIPYDRISLRPRYERLNPYRSILSAICQIDEAFSSKLLTDMARRLVSDAREEAAADVIRVDVNTITGYIQRADGELTELPDNHVQIIMDKNAPQVVLDTTKCKGIYLEEVDRRKMYETRYFTYG